MARFTREEILAKRAETMARYAAQKAAKEPKVHHQFLAILESLAHLEKQAGRWLASWIRSSTKQAVVVKTKNNGWYIAVEIKNRASISFERIIGIRQSWIDCMSIESYECETMPFEKEAGEEIHRLTIESTNSMRATRNRFFEDHPECRVIWCA